MTSKSVMPSSPQSAILAGNAGTKSGSAQGTSSGSTQFDDEFHSALQDRSATSRAEASKNTASPANVAKQQSTVASNFTRHIQQSDVQQSNVQPSELQQGDVQTIAVTPNVPAVPSAPVTDAANAAAQAALLALIAKNAPLSTQTVATNKAAATADASINGAKDKKAKKADPNTSTEAIDPAAAVSVPGLPVISVPVPASPVTANDSNTSTETSSNTATQSDNSQAPQSLTPLKPLPTPAPPAPTVSTAVMPAETPSSVPTGKESEAFSMLLTPKAATPPQQTAATSTPSNIPSSALSASAPKSDASAVSQPAISAKQAVNAVSVVDDNASNQASPERNTATSSATNSAPATPSSLEQDSDVVSRTLKPEDKGDTVAATAGANDATGTKQDLGGFGSTPESFASETKVSGQTAAPAASAASRTETQDSPAAATGSAKEVAIRLEGQSGQTINVKLVDQGGQVQVSVRSNDPAAATALRGDLSSLASNLDKAGWKPEITTVAGASSMETVNQTRQSDRNNQDSQGSRQPDWQQQDTPKKRQTVSDLWDQLLTTQNS